MKELLVEYLICPKCRKNFTLKAKKKVGNEIVEGELVCLKRHRFPISEGIPRLVVDKSKIFIKTENSFSAKWKNYNKTYHGKKWVGGQKKWFLERFGWNTISNLNKFLKTRTRVLDAGTGVGNSAEMLAVNKSSIVFALDASDSINFAYKKYRHLTNIHFIQADIRQLPFKKSFFNYIFSDQVLHHTKNTATSFKYLTKFLIKHGFISIYVYNRKAPIREYVDDYIRQRTIKMTVAECTEFSKDMAYLGKALSKLLQ